MIIIIDVVIVVFMEKGAHGCELPDYWILTDVCLLLHDQILCVKLSLDISY